jgi:hypothetical protein
VLDVSRCRVVMRRDVPDAVPAGLRAAIPGSAERRRWLGYAVAADLGPRVPDGAGRRVRLRRPRDVDRSLREVELRLREPDVLDGLGGSGRATVAFRVVDEAVRFAVVRRVV